MPVEIELLLDVHLTTELIRVNTSYINWHRKREKVDRKKQQTNHTCQRWRLTTLYIVIYKELRQNSQLTSTTSIIAQ